MAVSLQTIKNWFKTGLKPSQSQFWDTWDSFWHKDQNIPLEKIENLEGLLNEKTDVELFNTHANNQDVHITSSEKLFYGNKLGPWKQGEVLLDTGEILRLHNNNVYRFVGDTFPFTTEDIDDEIADNKWELALTGYVLQESNTIRVYNKSQIVNQDLDPTKVYKLEFSPVLTASESIKVGASLTLRGDGFNVTSISTNAENGLIFKSATGGSGDVILQEMNITASGNDAKVFDLEDSTGNHAIEFEYINFSGCASLGKIKSYRQGTGTTLGFYGGTPTLELDGNMNGFKISNSNCFGVSSSTILFKKGSDLKFANRFFLSVNLDLPTGAIITDFDEPTFIESELFQLNGCTVKVNGEINIDNADIIVPNISANSNKSLWVGNIGLPDTATEVLVEDDNVNNEYEIDWLKDTFFLTMTANTTFTQKNLPASGKNTQEIKLYLTGEFEPTFPEAYLINKVGTYKGTDINEISIKYIKDGVYFVRISNSLSVYPAPILGSLNPVSLLPDSTSELVISGSFYTPEGFVLIDGQVVNSIEFDPDTGNYILSVTTGSLEGEFDITISNGTSVTFESRMIVNLGEVFVPTENDWENISGSINISEEGKTRVSTYDSFGSATWNKEFDVSKSFIVRFKWKRTPLGTYWQKNEGARHISFINASDDTELFYLYLKAESSGGIWKSPGNIALYEYSYSDLNDENLENSNLEYRYIVGETLKLYQDNVLKSDTGLVPTENLKLKITIKSFDFVGIKYIEIP